MVLFFLTFPVRSKARQGSQQPEPLGGLWGCGTRPRGSMSGRMRERAEGRREAGPALPGRGVPSPGRAWANPGPR